MEWLASYKLYPSDVQSVFFAIEKEEDFDLAINRFEESIARVKTTMNTDSVAIYLIHYFNFPQLATAYPDQTKRFLLQSEEVISETKNEILQWSLLYQINNYYYEINDELKCLEYAAKCFSFSEKLNFPAIKALSHLCLGKAQELGNDHKSSLENFFKAHYLANISCPDEIKTEVLDAICTFYYHLNSSSKALSYASERSTLHPRDSLYYYYSLLDMLEFTRLSNSSGDFELNNWHQIMHFALRENMKRLEHFALAFLRTSLLDAGRSEELFNIYNTAYPAQFEELKVKEPLNYYRLVAHHYENINQLDSAVYFHKMALDFLNNNSPSLGYVYSVNMRYGDFLFERNQWNEAQEYFSKALDAAEKLQHFIFQINASKKLLSVLEKLGSFEKALHLNKKLILLEAQYEKLTHNREIVNMELQFSEQIRQEKLLQEEKELNLYHQNQYNLIIVFIAIFFCILLIATQFLIPIWIIRALGFLAFIFLFEYFIIKLDKLVYVITQQVPWKLFSLKVVLFAILLPLHHWLEKKAINYLVQTRSNRSSFLITLKTYFNKWFEKLNSDPNE